MKSFLSISMAFFFIFNANAQDCAQELDNYNEAEQISNALVYKINGMTQIYNQGIYGKETPEKMYKDIKDMETKWFQLLAEKRIKNSEYNDCVRKTNVATQSQTDSLRHPQYFKTFVKTVTSASSCAFVSSEAVKAVQAEQLGKFDGCILANEAGGKNYEKIVWWGSIEEPVSCTMTVQVQCYKY